METAHVVVRPLSPIGAEISGIDLSEELPDSVKRQLVEAYNTYAALIFHDQELSTQDQLRVAGIFGKVSEQGSAPGGYNFVTSVSQRGINEKGEMQLHSVGELKFHFGHSFHEEPLKGVMLYALELPPPGNGGDTLFADSRKAYALLPEALRQRIRGLKVRHRKPQDQSIVADHPLIYKHPDTGEDFLYLSNRHVDCILGVTPEESAALIAELASYIEDRPEIQYRHVWKLKDLAVWDNLRVQHARTHFDPALRRVLRRTQYE